MWKRASGVGTGGKSGEKCGPVRPEGGEWEVTKWLTPSFQHCNFIFYIMRYDINKK